MGTSSGLEAKCRRVGGVTVAVVVLTAGIFVVWGNGLAHADVAQSVGLIDTVSAPCSGQNAEVEQAVDPSGAGFVYEAWTGCGGIGFARSTNGGVSFGPAVMLPGSADSPGDPDVAVAPDGTVYVSFMMATTTQEYPTVDASFDDGVTFPQVTALLPSVTGNWGDSPNIAVGPQGTVYVTWDYGPSAAAVVAKCSPVGSCSYSKGDLNVVIQTSTDQGATFGAIIPVSPGFPWSGADNGPLVVDPSGRVDVLFQDYPTNAKTHVLSRAVNFFTASGDGGATWSAPVAVGAAVGTMSFSEWWNQPSLGLDPGGDLYAAWDTQGKTANGSRTDTGWLSYSEDGGATWSVPVQGPTDTKNVPHIMEVVGAGPGTADVGWLSDSSPLGYALYLRPFSVLSGWTGAALRVSKLFGTRTVWPGDTFGLSTINPTHIVTSWGSAVPGSNGDSRIYAATVTRG